MACEFSKTELFPPAPPVPAFFDENCLQLRKEIWNLRQKSPASPEEITYLEFSELGRPLRTVVRSGETGALVYREELSYDEWGHVKDAVYQCQKATGLLEGEERHHWNWEKEGRRFQHYRDGRLAETWEQNPNRTWTKTWYGEAGRPAGNETVDPEGRILAVEDYKSGETINYEYDEQGELESEEILDTKGEGEADVGYTRYRNVYDSAGRIVERWAGPNLVRRLYYSASGRLAEEVYYIGIEKKVKAVKYHCELTSTE